MIRSETIEQFLQNQDILLLDVRSPLEYQKGHIPGAVSFPLFTDEERSTIGTKYKQEGKDSAVLAGLEFVGPRMADMVRTVKRLTQGQTNVRVYCWRGGMRSGSVAWLLSNAGFEVSLLLGGYKKWRNFTEMMFTRKLDYQVLGGYTGSGKTEILHELNKLNVQVIDLERLANHKGSSFGSIGMKDQPTQEHFENLLAWEILHQKDTLPVWIEDESRMIGRITMPAAFWEKKLESTLYFIQVPREDRIQRLVSEYASAGKDILEPAIRRIHRKLGDVRLMETLEALMQNDFSRVADLVLYYYDKAYNTGLRTLKNPEQVIYLNSETGVESLIQALLATSTQQRLKQVVNLLSHRADISEKD